MSEEGKVKSVGHIPSGLFIVCAQDQAAGQIDGYLASWIQQISFKPMLISLSIKPGRPCYDLIKKGQVFTVNIVGTHERNYLKHFWKGYDPQSNPFAEIPYEVSSHGGVMLKDAKSVIECRLKEIHQPGDHELIIAEVIDGHVFEEEAKPYVHLRRSGLDY